MTTASDARPQPEKTAPGPSLLPRLAVGCMNFGKRTSAEESIRIVGRAIERGLTWFDTANVYNEGESEVILGRALAAERPRYLVATKVGLARTTGKPEGLRPERVLRAIDESLGRLNTSYVDIYYLHAPDHATPLAETLDAMNLADARGMARPVVAQQIYNPMIRQLDIEWFAFAKAHPIHTTVYNPLAGGLLTGKHTGGAPAAGSRFDGNAMYMRRYWSGRMLEHARACGKIATDGGMSVVDLAYGWVSGRPGVDSVLLGPASVEQLDAGVDGCARALAAETRKKVDELYRSFQGTDATYAR